MLANDGQWELVESNGTPTPLAMGRISVSEIATATFSTGLPCSTSPASALRG